MSIRWVSSGHYRGGRHPASWAYSEHLKGHVYCAGIIGEHPLRTFPHEGVKGVPQWGHRVRGSQS